MFRTALALLVAGAQLVGIVRCAAQGTKDRNASYQGSATSKGGVGTNRSPDTMGGAFKVTGMPTYGTSPGMGSAKRPRN